MFEEIEPTVLCRSDSELGCRLLIFRATQKNCYEDISLIFFYPNKVFWIPKVILALVQAVDANDPALVILVGWRDGQ